MNLKPSEIELIIDHYVMERLDWQCRLDHIVNIGDTDFYDDDLIDTQIQRIHTQMYELGERIKELEELRKELL